MKTRNSLVSNSSSSSFIIAYKRGEKCKHCGRSDPDLEQIIRSKSSENSNYEVYATGKDEIIKQMKTGYDGNPAEMTELFDKINKLDDDYTVIYFSMSHHDFEFIDDVTSAGQLLYRGES